MHEGDHFYLNGAGLVKHRYTETLEKQIENSLLIHP